MKTWIAAVLFAGWVVGSGLGLAQGGGPVSGPVSGLVPEKRPMTFADLQKMKRVSDPQISAGGKWVMFSVTDVSLEKNTKELRDLWVVPLGGWGRDNCRFLRCAAETDNAKKQDENKKGQRSGS